MDNSSIQPLDASDHANDKDSIHSSLDVDFQATVSDIHVNTCVDHASTHKEGSSNIANVHPIITNSSKYQSPQDVFIVKDQAPASKSLSLFTDNLPVLKTISITSTDEAPSKIVEANFEDQPICSSSEQVQEFHQQEDKIVINKSPTTCALALINDVNQENEFTDTSDIDEDALSIIIAVEGEEEESDRDQHTGDCVINNKLHQSTESLIDLTAPPKTGFNDMEANEPSEDTHGAGEGKFAIQSNGKKSCKHDKSSSKQSAKVKQFFTTLQMFGNKISQEVAEQVQELIAALVNDLVSVEEFHTEIQKVTNHPMKEFVVPFLKENLSHFCEELKSTSLALSDILGAAPKSNAPAVATEILEPELVVVHSTKPSTPATITTVVSLPTSPLRAPANLMSMSVPPATIHEPQLISPTKIESVLNASAVSSNGHRKRPRDLVIGNGSDDKDGAMAISMRSKRPRPIPTATLTPEPAVSSTLQNTPIVPHAAQTSSDTYTIPLSTGHCASFKKNLPISAANTTLNIEMTKSVLLSMSNSQHMAFVTQIKEDWNHLETMFVSVEGMVVKTQKALSSLKERIQQIGLSPSHSQLKAHEVEIEQKYLQKFEKAMDEVQQQANEEKQNILLDATKQVQDALREFNTQSNSEECCWNCGRKATETCSGCNKARYCGTFCQHKDWDKHMSHCSGAKPSSTGIQVEKDRPQVQSCTVSHNNFVMKLPSFITGPHSSSSYGRSTSSQAATPNSYSPDGSEVFVPVINDPNLSNRSNIITPTSVAVVTITRNTSDIVTNTGISIV